MGYKCEITYCACVNTRTAITYIWGISIKLLTAHALIQGQPLHSSPGTAFRPCSRQDSRHSFISSRGHFSDGMQRRRNDMNGVLDHDSGLVRLYWAGDNRGE